jgi:hypothetical protein
VPRYAMKAEYCPFNSSGIRDGGREKWYKNECASGDS